MNSEQIFELLKADLDILMLDENKQAFLQQCFNAAVEFIEREGITLNYEDSFEDAQLVVMYAAYLYRKRAVNVGNSYEGRMPRMLRYALNNRLISEKAGASDAT